MDGLDTNVRKYYIIFVMYMAVDIVYSIALDTSVVVFTIVALKMHSVDRQSLLAQPLTRILLRDSRQFCFIIIIDPDLISSSYGPFLGERSGSTVSSDADHISG